MAGKIFISYRREDSIDVTGRIYDWLLRAIPREDIFMDLDSIPAGVDFRAHIDGAIAQSALMLVVIGRSWAAGAAGHCRLDDPGDFVRIEIEAAMRRNVPIVPLLVQNAVMPCAGSLPGPLAPLAYRNALSVRSGTDFPRDIDRVMKAVEIYRTDANGRPEERQSGGTGTAAQASPRESQGAVSHPDSLARHVARVAPIPLERLPEGRVAPVVHPGPRTTPGRARKTLQEREFLEGFADSGYRSAVKALLEACRGLGLKLKYGAAGVAIRLAVRDRALPLSVGRLFPPGKGAPGFLRDIVLGFDSFRAEEAPSSLDALEAYVGALTALEGTEPSPAPIMRGRLIPPEVLIRHREEIFGALADLVRRVNS